MKGSALIVRAYAMAQLGVSEETKAECRRAIALLESSKQPLMAADAPATVLYRKRIVRHLTNDRLVIRIPQLLGVRSDPTRTGEHFVPLTTKTKRRSVLLT